MRRVIIAVSVAALLVSFVSASASASTSKRRGIPVSLHKSWVQWAFGSSGAPLLHKHFCGEEVDGIFYLTIAGGSATSVTRRIDCEIPRGVPVLATVGGAISWAPTDGRTDRQLTKSMFTFLALLRVNSVHVRLDGDEIAHGPLEVPNPFDIALEPGNLIETVDPGVTGDKTRIADGLYFERLAPLSPGDHVLLATDKFDFRSQGGEVARYRTVFNIHVS